MRSRGGSAKRSATNILYRFAGRIHRELHARRSLGVHWGTFSLTDEALDQPPKDLAAARKAQGVADDAFFTLAIGETRKLPARQATP